MTRTSLHDLATSAGLWPVRVEGTAEVRLDPGEVLRFGAEADVSAVAEVMIRHRLKQERGAVDDADVRAELAKYGYAASERRRAKAVSKPSVTRLPALRRSCRGMTEIVPRSCI